MRDAELITARDKVAQKQAEIFPPKWIPLLSVPPGPAPDLMSDLQISPASGPERILER